MSRDFYLIISGDVRSRYAFRDQGAPLKLTCHIFSQFRPSAPQFILSKTPPHLGDMKPPPLMLKFFGIF